MSDDPLMNPIGREVSNFADEMVSITVLQVGFTALRDTPWRSRGGLPFAGDFCRCYRTEADGATLRFNNRSVKLRGGRFYIVPPGAEVHGVLDRPQMPIRQLYLHFRCDGIYFCRELVELPEDAELARLGDRLQDLIRSDRWFFDAMPEKRLEIILAAQLLLAAALPLAIGEIGSARPEDPLMLRIISELSFSLDRKLSPEFFCRNYGLTRAELLRRFRAAAGQPLYRFITELRYRTAAKLLLESHLPVKEVCRKVGINDQYHFSREFKRRYGMPPSVWAESPRYDGEHAIKKD